MKRIALFVLTYTFLWFFFPGSVVAYDNVAFGITGRWDSKYVSEGRDNLEEGGLFSVDSSAEWSDLALGVWFAFGDSETYEELNLYIQYGVTFGPVEVYLGYARLEFTHNDESDNEIAAGIAIEGLPWLTPAIDYTYSTEAEGGFLELSLASEIVLLDERVVIVPYVLEGLDFGYASEDHDGANNLQVGMDLDMPITDNISIVGLVSYSWALRDVKKDELSDEAWVAVGLSSSL